MQVKKHPISDTSLRLTIVANPDELHNLKQHTLEHMQQRHSKIPGFREGKAPLALVEKRTDPEVLATEFIDSAINQLYIRALESEELRPISQPSIKLSKFVPFSTLEFEAEFEIIGNVKLADYKKVKVPKKLPEVTAKEVNEVIETLRSRAADKKTVDRAAKTGDEVVIDFEGVDKKSGASIKGADGKKYPLLLGSNSFIPGFEKELVGLKSGQTKSFDITFPKDYGVSALQNKQVTFTVVVNAVSELAVPPLDDNLVAKISPFKTTKELKADVKKQLQEESKVKAERDYENELLGKITEASTIAIPKSLVDEQIARAEEDERQNLTYRGQTWQEHLAEEGLTEEEHRERNRAGAEQVVKAGLILSEIAEKESVRVSPEEVEIRLQLLKGQYPDQQMQMELDKPDSRQTIMNQIATEKTFKILSDYATKNN